MSRFVGNQVLDVQVFEVGGQRMIPGGDISLLAIEGSWRNVIDAAAGTSLATVRLQKCDPPDERLDVITPFLHELRISLDKEIVFEGPVFQFAAQISKGAEIVAYDMSAWFAWRFVRDTFDYSTGVPVSTFIQTLVKSAIKGGPSWPGYDYMGIMSYLNVKSIPKVINRQNGSLIHREPFVGTTTYAQGDRGLTDPHEYVWDSYLSFLVGKLAHMSCQGRRINFWPYGSSLEQLPVADVSDFTDFPNLVRDGSRFTTGSTAQVATDSVTMGDPILPTNASEGAKTGFSSFNVLSDPTGFAVQIPFYVGQILTADTSLAMPIGTQYLSQQFFPGFAGASQPATAVTIDRLFIGAISAGGRISGEVFGHAGGKHPDWPVLVERYRSEPDVVGQPQAGIIATSMIQTSVPFDSLDVEEFDVALTSTVPWDFRKVVPGYTALITTRLGGINLQVSSTSGKWESTSDGPKLDLTVGLRTLPTPPGTLPDNRVYPQWSGNGVAEPAATVVSPTVSFNHTRNRIRRNGEDPNMADIYFTSTGKPLGWFVRPATFVGVPSGDVAALQAATPGYTSATVSNQFFDLLVIACQQGAAF